MKSIFDPTFRYTPSYSTDLRKTFARIRHEKRRSEQPARAPTAGANVTVLDVGERRSAAGPRGGRRG
jgi:hypothetical protein